MIDIDNATRRSLIARSFRVERGEVEAATQRTESARPGFPSRGITWKIATGFLDFARNDSLEKRGCLIISRRRILSLVRPTGFQWAIFMFRIRTAAVSMQI